MSKCQYQAPNCQREGKYWYIREEVKRVEQWVCENCHQIIEKEDNNE